MRLILRILFLIVFAMTATSPLFAQATFTAKTDFTTGANPYSVCIGDLNGDGLPDLAVTNDGGTTVSVFLNTTVPGASTPSFTAKTDFTTGTSPYSVCIGDLNGDGMPDLAVANYHSSTVSVFLNTTAPGASTPSFAAKTDFTTGAGPFSVCIGDLNGDGKPDLVVGNSASTTVSVLLNTTTPGASTPSFTAKTDFTTGTNPYSVCIGDLNGDGKPDLAVANNVSNTVSVFLNTTAPGASTPSFTAKTDFTTGTSPYSVCIGDLNGDGMPDLTVANRGAPPTVSVFLNTTTPGASTLSFAANTDFTTGTGAVSVCIGDLNGDGMPDLAVTNQGSNTVSVFLNITTPGASTPSFTAKTDFTTGTSPYSVCIGDLNGDGKSDLAVANQSSITVSVLLNTTVFGAAAPSFTATTNFNTGGASPYSVCIGDLNGDGKPDLVVPDQGSDLVSVYMNTTTPGANAPTFAAVAYFGTGSQPQSVCIGDLNGDGKPDIAVANSGTNTVSVLLNNTSPGVTTPSFSAKTDLTTDYYPSSICIGDLNGDGKPDLITANPGGSGPVSVLLNTTALGASTPSFSAKTSFTIGGAYSICIGDLNGDGKPDLVVGNQSGFAVSVLLNTTTPGASTPSFTAKTSVATGSFPFSVSMGDLNGDGKLDIATPNYGDGTVSVLLNTTTPGATTPSFTTHTDFTAGTYPCSVCIGDLNGDGKPDLVVASISSATESVFLNTTAPGATTPSFSAKTDFNTGYVPNFVCIGNLNGDGKPDLVTANKNDRTISVLLNNVNLPLPVELTSFTASANGSFVTLYWHTATEVKNYGFEIERASTLLAANWEKIGFVQGHGNSNSPKNYSFIDTNSVIGSVQYRLKQIDNDGSFKYSQIVEASFMKPDKFELSQNYPNPFNPTTTISYSLPKDSKVVLEVYNTIGQRVATLENGEMRAGNHNVEFNASQLASGIYFYKMQTNGFVSVKKLLLLK
ncbi:MAG: T9SS type A sorting domain-containing protein [Ignavibacteriaceae bacterium]